MLQDLNEFKLSLKVMSKFVIKPETEPKLSMVSTLYQLVHERYIFYNSLIW